MANTLILYVSVFCAIAMLFGMSPSSAAPAPQSNGELDAAERDVSYYTAFCIFLFELCLLLFEKNLACSKKCYSFALAA